MLEVKAPHHPASSWRQHMRGSDSIIEKIMHAVDEDSSSSASRTSSEYDQDFSNKSFQDQDDSEEDLESEDSAEDEHNMGSQRVYTAADRRLLAKYIASVENWEGKNDVERFTAFYERYPHKALSSWSRFYIRHSTDMDTLVRKYKQRLRKSMNVPAAIPPIPQSEIAGSDTLPPALKRKNRYGGGEGIHSAKRSRATDSEENLPLSRGSVLISD